GASAAYPVATAWSSHLARDDQLVAPLARQPAADDRLGVPLCAAVRRHGVHLGGIDEVDAVRDGVVELLVRLRFGVLLAPGHRAEANLGNRQRGSLQRVV